MATILFNDAATNPSLVASFDPANDVLVISDASAADVKLSAATGSITLTTDAGSVTLDVDLKTVTSGSTGFVRFIDGSVLVIGDETTSTVADDLANTAFGGDGNDQMRGLGGNDTLYGGEGNDQIYGNLGNDSIWAATANDGNDTIFAGQGDDTIYTELNDGDIVAYGNLDDDSIRSGDGDDVLYGGQGDDTMRGNDGDDSIYGNAGNDIIESGDGSDVVFGGQGNDLIYGGFSGSGHNILYGNLGDDTIYADSSGDVVYAGQGNDTIQGSSGDDVLRGNLGNDLIVNNSASGEDTAIGGDGNDTVAQDFGVTTATLVQGFDDANDMVVLAGVTALDIAQNAYGGGITNVDNRANLLHGANIDLNGDFGAMTLEGAAGLTLTGSNLDFTDGTVFAYNVGGSAAGLDGGDFNDFLVAGDNGDTITAGAGADTVIGGDGDDLFVMDVNLTSADIVYGGDGDDTMTLSVDNATSFSTGTDSIEQFIVDWTGGAGTAFLGLYQDSTFNVDASSLTVGQDIQLAAVGNTVGVTMTTGTGNDTVQGSDATVSGDTLVAGDGDDEVWGYGGADLLDGDLGADMIYGGAGADTMTGGDGADSFIFLTASDSGFTTASVDHVTDFSADDDFIVFSGGGGVHFDERLIDQSGSTDLADAALAAYTAAATVAANDSVLFSFGGRDYVYVNDGTGAFSSVDDLLVDVTGFTGTITDANFA